MRILFITDTLPHPPVSGNRLRVYHLCREIAREHELWLIAGARSVEEAESASVAHMREFCHEVTVVVREHYGKLQHVPGLIRFALAGRPLEHKFEYSQAMEDTIRRVTASHEFDIVHIEPSYSALYREALSQNGRTGLVLGFHNIEFQLFQQMVRVERSRRVRLRAYLHSALLRRWEPRYAANFDRCITCSEDDRQLLLSANPRLNVDVIANGVDTQEYQLLPEENDRPTVLFIGSMNYAPCADGAVLFCEQMLPVIQQEIPDVDVWIVGRDPLPHVQKLARDNVHVTGWVDDIMPFYRRSTISIVPLRAGGGTRLKVLEAMALGRAMVSTSIGCAGIDVVDGEHIFITDDTQDFALKTVQLLSDRQLRARMVANARKRAEEKYDWGVLADGLTQGYRDLLPPETRRQMMTTGG
jgi:polysaccharide biosynthesis protein PslH